VTSYDLDLDYRVSSNRLDARATLVVTLRRPTARLVLDLVGLKVGKVTVDGRRPARFAVRNGRLRIDLAAEARPGQQLTLAVRYGGRPAPLASVWGDVGWEELSDGVIVAGQPGGAPTWFPCNDRPDNKATYRIRITADSAYTALANGRLMDRRIGAGRTTWLYRQAEPTASYLATLQIGRYDVRRLSSSPVPQLLLAPPALRAGAASDLDRQPAMIRVFNDLFGRYPFEEYLVVVTQDELEIPLEAQGMAVFGANHLTGDRRFERLVAHELAHQWFGNSLTLADWPDVWLHEGFACYAEWLWSERSGGDSADRLARHHHARLARSAQDLVVADPGAEKMFDDRLYKRGALTLHAVRSTLGDPAFFAMLKDWATRFRHGTVTTQLFAEHVAGYADVGDLLSRWLGRARLPDLP
jgi:aminopeptidase N